MFSCRPTKYIYKDGQNIVIDINDSVYVEDCLASNPVLMRALELGDLSILNGKFRGMEEYAKYFSIKNNKGVYLRGVKSNNNKEIVNKNISSAYIQCFNRDGKIVLVRILNDEFTDQIKKTFKDRKSLKKIMERNDNSDCLSCHAHLISK